MVTRKWLFSYRILTSRLREGGGAPTVRVAGMNGGPASTSTQSRSIDVSPAFAKTHFGKRTWLFRAGEKN
jgi:hypothetical protein